MRLRIGNLGSSSKTKATFEKTLNLTPETRGPELQLNDLNLAQSFYERALQLEPDDEQAQKKLSLLHIKRNDRFHADNI